MSSKNETTNSKCVVCNSPILREFIERPIGHPLIGEKFQFELVFNGFFCDHCGIRYAKLPSEEYVKKQGLDYIKESEKKLEDLRPFEPLTPEN